MRSIVVLALSPVMLVLGPGCPRPCADNNRPACPRAPAARGTAEVILQGAPPIPRSLKNRLKQYLAVRGAKPGSFAPGDPSNHFNRMMTLLAQAASTPGSSAESN